MNARERFNRVLPWQKPDRVPNMEFGYWLQPRTSPLARPLRRADVRQEYGQGILLIGGVNKLSLIRGKEAIDRELENLHPLVERGGFIPCVDHRVPPDVSFENSLYYRKKKKELL